MSEELSLYDVLYKLDYTKINRCEAMDPILESKIEDVDTVLSLGYHLNNTALVDRLPKTKIKINQIVQKAIEDNLFLDSYRLGGMRSWLNSKIHNALARKYLKDKSWDIKWIIKSVEHLDNDVLLDLFDDIFTSYTKRKSRYDIERLELVFKNLKNDVEKCAEKLTQGTPALSACLLSRNDIQEKHIIKGLKSLSKLSRQRATEVKIDFNMLKNLGPKSRLDAIKQLLGMNLGYLDPNRVIPFKEMPTKEDIETFLFPCSLKYNEEVSRIIERYENIIAKENNNAKS